MVNCGQVRTPNLDPSPVPYCNMAAGIRGLNKTQLKLNFLFLIIYKCSVFNNDDQPFTFTLSKIVNADDLVLTLRVKTVIYIVQKILTQSHLKLVQHLKHDKYRYVLTASSTGMFLRHQVPVCSYGIKYRYVLTASSNGF